MSKKELLEKILSLWETVPDMRLGQLMCNAGMRNNSDDLYYIEDQDLLKQMEALVEKK